MQRQFEGTHLAPQGRPQLGGIDLQDVAPSFSKQKLELAVLSHGPSRLPEPSFPRARPGWGLHRAGRLDGAEHSPLFCAASIQGRAVLGEEPGPRIARLGVPPAHAPGRAVVVNELRAEIDASLTQGDRASMRARASRPRSARAWNAWAGTSLVQLVRITLEVEEQRNPKQVRDTLRNSRDAKHRSVAAKALSYLEDKSEVVADLAFAMTDPDSAVRNNAIRAL